MVPGSFSTIVCFKNTPLTKSQSNKKFTSVTADSTMVPSLFLVYSGEAVHF